MDIKEQETAKDAIHEVLQDFDQYSPCLHRTLLDRIIPLVRADIQKNLEEMKLIKDHNHKKGEIKIVSCARCTYDVLKSGTLKEEKKDETCCDHC